ncbi:MAG: amidohydrolase family protein, partial [Saprospiraceae bacterium]|nr:amidohydrolase family protein [Saprospiraceae bacterium]
AGGFTGLALFPNTNPPIDDKSSLQFIINATQSLLVDFYPIGAISKNIEGKEITEMMDMAHNGAVAFSDGIKSVQLSGLLLRALQYAKSINGLIIHHPDDSSLSNENQIHEGIVSTSLGLKGSPSIAEVLTLERDVLLSQYAETQILLHNLSSGQSIDRLKQLDSDNIFASVSYLNLCKSDEALSGFDVQYKVNPPLRSEVDQQALVKATRKGVIQIINANHVPLEEEQKKKEFVYAELGAIGLQTCFAALRTFAPKLDTDTLVNCLAINPRKILGLEKIEFTAGHSANLTIFDLDEQWTFDRNNNHSKSKNSPFFGQEFDAKVVGIINGRKSHFNNY